MSHSPRKILVIRSSAMGDVAMTAPVLAEVVRLYPNLKVVMLTREFYAPFFDGIPNLEIHNIDLAEHHRGSGGLIRIFRELRREHPDMDMIVDLNDKIYSKLLRKFFIWLNGIPYFHIDKGRDEKKALTRRDNKVKVQLRTSVERYADVFRRAGFDLPPVPESLELRRRERPVPPQVDTALREPDRWIGIAPFAKHKGKVYPLEKIKKVVALLVEKYPTLRIYIFGGGELEKEQAEELVTLFPWNCISVIGRFTLREEMDLMANLDLIVSMDSSAMHMASLVGTPVVSVWGASHPYAGFLGLGQLPEDAIGLEELPCRPCSVYGHKECWHNGGDYACLYRLPPERIFERITYHLDK